MASVKQSWIKKYGEEKGLEMWQQQKKKYGKTKKQLIQKYGKQYVQQMLKKRATFCQQYYIDKYGQIEGKIKWQEIKLKKVKNTYKTINDQNFNRKKFATNSLERYQQKYGIKNGYDRWRKRCLNTSYMSSRIRYINQFGETLGTKICKTIKTTNSLEKYIFKYGEKLGKEKYKQFCERISIAIKNSHKNDPTLRFRTARTLQNFQKKYGKSIGELKYKQYRLKNAQQLASISFRRYSKKSQMLFWNIYNNIDDIYKEKCKFGQLEGQERFYIDMNDIKQYIFVDFKCGNVIIQYDGSYWHMDSDVYQSDEINKKLSKSAKQIWQFDANRQSYLTNKGYKFMRIKQKYFDELGCQKVTNICLEYIYENAQI